MSSDNPFEPCPEYGNVHGWATSWEWRVPKDMKVAAPLLDYEVDGILREHGEEALKQFHADRRGIADEHRIKRGRLSFRND